MLTASLIERERRSKSGAPILYQSAQLDEKELAD